MAPRSDLPRPCLVLITDRHAVGARPLETVVAAAVTGGVDLVQLREKDLAPAALARLAECLLGAIGDRARLVVNGPVDVALAVGAAGVHLPEAAPWPDPALRAARPGFLVGRSVHDVAAARAAATSGADYVQFGTVFPSRSKPGRAAAGLTALAGVCRAVPCPVIAVGGIDAGNAAEVIRARAAGCAVISAILAAPDPEAATRALRAALDAAHTAVAGSAPAGLGPEPA